MDLTLRNVKINRSMSQETECFSATICLDGKPVGSAMNRGQGGANEYSWKDRDARDRIQSWAEKQPLEFEFEKLDQIVGRKLAESEVEAKLRRDCRKMTLFRLKDDPRGHWRTVRAAYCGDVRKFIDGQYGDKVEFVANTDPADAVRFC